MSASTPNAPGAHAPLKRLSLVGRLLHLALSTIHVGYLWVRSWEPRAISPVVQKAEDIAIAIAGPVVAKVQGYGDFMLHFADDEADMILQVVEHGVAGLTSTAKSGSDGVTQAVQPYLRALQKVSTQISQKLHSVSGIQAAEARLHTVIAQAQDCTDPDYAIKLATDAWVQFAAFPPVATFLSVTEPLSNRGLWAFRMFHDRLVAMRIYKAALDITACTLTYASTTTPYKLSAQYLYPVVQPMADPAIEKVTHSKAVQQAIEFWKPVVI